VLCFFISLATPGDVSQSGGAAVSVYAFLVLVVCSRVFLWTFDLVEVQMLQENIPESDRGTVNAVEKSLTNLATMVGMVLGMIFSTTATFYVLVIISLACLVMALVLYGLFYSRKRHSLA
jgi:solute carrier family 40 (iron-regulated transporter), member 1